MAATPTPEEGKYKDIPSILPLAPVDCGSLWVSTVMLPSCDFEERETPRPTHKPTRAPTPAPYFFSLLTM